MTPYPGPRSVMIVDNCGTHRSQAVQRAVEAAGEYFRLKFLHNCIKSVHKDADMSSSHHIPQISAPLKRASAVVSSPVINKFCVLTGRPLEVKAYIRRNFRHFQNSQFPERDLAEACFNAITAEKARGWFRDCGYL